MVFKMADTFLTNKKFKDFFQKKEIGKENSIAVLNISKIQTESNSQQHGDRLHRPEADIKN